MNIETRVEKLRGIYSRPIHLIVPQLKEIHAKEEAKVNDICTYYETPGKVGDTIILLKKLLEESKRIV